MQLSRCLRYFQYLPYILSAGSGVLTAQLLRFFGSLDGLVLEQGLSGPIGAQRSRGTRSAQQSQARRLQNPVPTAGRTRNT